MTILRNQKKQHNLFGLTIWRLGVLLLQRNQHSNLTWLCTRYGSRREQHLCRSPSYQELESCLWTLWFNTCMKRKVKINQLLGTAEESFAPGAVWKKNTQTSEGLKATNIDSAIEPRGKNRSTHQLFIHYAEKDGCTVSSCRGSFPRLCAVALNQIRVTFTLWWRPSG